MQKTKLAQLSTLAINQKLADKIGAKDNAVVNVTQGNKHADFILKISNDLPESTVLFAANSVTCGFAGRFDQIEIKVS